MKISDQTIKFFGTLLTGSDGRPPFRSDQDLVQFFNQFGNKENNNSSVFHSRGEFAQQRLKKLNGTQALSKVFTRALDPRAFVGSNVNVDDLAEDINKFLKTDGYQLVKHGDYFYARELVSGMVDIETPALKVGTINLTKLNKMIYTANKKLVANDLTAALSHSQRLLESVLLEIEKSLAPTPPAYDKNLIKLFQRVQKLLNLDPNREDISAVLRSVLTGLAVIGKGLAGLHGKPYNLARHHTKLAVNTSRVLAEFLFETYIYQCEKGLIRPIHHQCPPVTEEPAP